MSHSHPLDDRIQQVNRRLQSARLGIAVERRGEKLCLRGTLPPRPDSPRIKPYQQRIPLGYSANKAGLKQIEQDAKLIEKTFNWQEYIAPVKDSFTLDLDEMIAVFEADFFQQPIRDAHQAAQRKSTWQKAYAPYLRKLIYTHHQHPRLSISEAIYITIEAIPANTRGRQICCTALKRFASFSGIDLPTDLTKFLGAYSSNHPQARQLPSDEDILKGFTQIPNPAWRFVYGIMATYGLRNHEVFFCDYSNLQKNDPEARLTVLESTKTGLHDVWPFYPEWVEQFRLRQVNLPKINLDLNQTTLQKIGQQVSKQFQRYKIPFSPYDLRHAWAVRTIHFGLPDTVAAKMMGHSVSMHNRTYHRWITLRDQQQAVRNALSRKLNSP